MGKWLIKMLIGTYYHTLEDTGRVSLPKPFRDEQASWIVTRGLDGCLFLLKPEQFAQELAQITTRTFTSKDTRDLTRLFANEAKEVAADKTGRVQLPEYLIKFAQLSKSLVIVGSITRIEIWDRERYHTYLAQLEPQAENLAEKFAANEE
jgi:MraZ protein